MSQMSTAFTASWVFLEIVVLSLMAFWGYSVL